MEEKKRVEGREVDYKAKMVLTSSIWGRGLCRRKEGVRADGV